MHRTLSTAVLAAAFVVVLAPVAAAAPYLVTLQQFLDAPDATLTTFEDVPAFTEASGLTVGGLTFTYAGGSGQAIISPSTETTDVTGNTLAIPAPFSALTIDFDAPVSAFGTGFAFLSGPAQDVLSIELFDGDDSLGAISFDSEQDNFVAGGFAGIGNDAAFDRVVLTFTDPAAFAGAIDNLRTIPAQIPEPGTLTLLGLALGAFARRRRC